MSDDDYARPLLQELPKQCPKCGKGFPVKSVSTVADHRALLEVTLACANCGHQAVMTARSI